MPASLSLWMFFTDALKHSEDLVFSVSVCFSYFVMQNVVGALLVQCCSVSAQVDNYIKEVAWKVFQTGYPGFVPGLYKNGVLNTKVPLGGLLRLSFHDAGPFNK